MVRIIFAVLNLRIYSEQKYEQQFYFVEFGGGSLIKLDFWQLFGR